MIVVTIESAGTLDDFFRHALDETAKSIRGQLESVRCPEHGEPPNVVIQVSAARQVAMQIRGCCEKLVQLAEATVK